MVVAMGVREGGGWRYGNLAFQRSTGAEGDQSRRPPTSPFAAWGRDLNDAPTQEVCVIRG